MHQMKGIQNRYKYAFIIRYNKEAKRRNATIKYISLNFQKPHFQAVSLSIDEVLNRRFRMEKLLQIQRQK